MDQPRRLYIHVGLQKTGTSYLQGAMAQNRELLAGRGLDLVPPTKRETFELMLLVRDRYQPDKDPDTVPGALDRLRRTLADARGHTALISQESLAACRPAQIERLLSACTDREVHVVASVRDLGRQLPSSWQQEIKAGKTERYGHYLRRLRAAQESGSVAHPWIHLDPPAVLARWAEHVPADRIHVVTVPQRGGSPTLLLERFCAALGVDPSDFEPEDSPVNTSLGRVQAEVLRRVNAELPEEMRRRQVYGDHGKRFLSSRVLTAQGGRRIVVPNDYREWCEEVTSEHIASLTAAGYAVSGDLEDLRSADAAFGEDERPADGEVAKAAVAALARVLVLRAQGRGASKETAPSPRRRRLFGLRR